MGKSRRASAGLAALAILTLGAEARAGLLEFYAQVESGFSGGTGVYGDRRDEAFHAGTGGLSYGGLLGVELAFIDVWIEHNQYLGGSGISGTWTQFMAGFDVDFDLSDATAGGTPGPNGRLQDAYAPWYGSFGLGLGFGVGTGQQVEPPLDNSEITDKGFLVQGSLGVGYRLHPLLAVGLRLPLQASYLLKTGEGVVANDTTNHYGSIQGGLLLEMRINLAVK
jgi:hypothetical protein